MKVYNDLIKDKAEFEPLQKGAVSMYVCGPTVYDSPHIGHARAAVAFDVIRRYFKFKGWDVKYASNYTDVDDKMINRAEEMGVSVSDLAKKYITEYEEVMYKLNVLSPDIKPVATESIKEIIELIKLIEKNGYAYVSNGSVYFDVEKFAAEHEYNGLFKRKTPKKDKSAESEEETKEAEQAEDAEEADDLSGSHESSDFLDEKRNERDFALWKAEKPGEPSWDSPWGKGRPGWHIECSAMVYKHFGNEIDIHGGGKDLIFPHHTNEIAQTKAAVGTLLARYWLHNGFVNINNEKMSKSLKNFFTISEVLNEYDGMVLRLFLTSVSYKKPINYTIEALDEAKSSLSKIIDFYNSIRTINAVDNGDESISSEVSKYRDNFINTMDDDFNTSEALNQVYQLIRFINRKVIQEQKSLSKSSKKQIIDFIMDFSRIFGIIIDANKQELGIYGQKSAALDSLIGQKEDEIAKLMETIIEVRNQLRKKKLYDVADMIRDKLKSMGIELSDMKGKTLWKYTN